MSQESPAVVVKQEVVVKEEASAEDTRADTSSSDVVQHLQDPSVVASLEEHVGGDDDGDSWCVPASDDEELYGGWSMYEEEIAPPLPLIQSLYQTLEKGENLSLLWRCPGRRSLDPEPCEGDQVNQGVELPDMSDFDFASDEFAQPVTTPRRQPGTGPRGSAKKKSTSFDSILKNMKRTREIEAQEALQETAEQLRTAKVTDVPETAKETAK